MSFFKSRRVLESHCAKACLLTIWTYWKSSSLMLWVFRTAKGVAESALEWYMSKKTTSQSFHFHFFCGWVWTWTDMENIDLCLTNVWLLCLHEVELCNKTQRRIAFQESLTQQDLEARLRVPLSQEATRLDESGTFPVGATRTTNCNTSSNRSSNTSWQACFCCFCFSWELHKTVLINVLSTELGLSQEPQQQSSWQEGLGLADFEDFATVRRGWGTKCHWRILALVSWIGMGYDHMISYDMIYTILIYLDHIFNKDQQKTDKHGSIWMISPRQTGSVSAEVQVFWVLAQVSICTKPPLAMGDSLNSDTGDTLLICLWICRDSWRILL